MSDHGTIKLKRVYEQESPDDGTRFLVDRLWPRGIAKSNLPLDRWLKEASPSRELCRWFAHDPSKWDEFRKRYFAELDANPGAVEQIASTARQGPVTLIYSARDAAHNNAVALREYLDRRKRRRQEKP